MRKILMFVIMVSVFLMMGCTMDADSQQAYQQRAYLNEANAQIGMPAIKNFQERKLLKLILELRDKENLVCFAYIVAANTGELKFLGKCIGYGIPYSTQYTSPVVPQLSGTGHAGDPQADPNGLFMPDSADGTWVMLIGPDNNPHPTYVEPRVIISAFPLK